MSKANKSSLQLKPTQPEDNKSFKSQKKSEFKDDTDIIKEKKPKIKLISMRNLEVIVIGPPKTGKSTLIKRLVNDPSIDLPYIPKVGMTVYKKEHVAPSGETIRLCFWDPAMRTLPREWNQKAINEQKAKREKKDDFYEALKSGDIWDFFKPIGDDECLPYFDEFQKDTNKELTKDYLFSATPHFAIFTFDITDAESFEEMEKWFDLFKRTCGKSCNNINYAIVATKSDLVKEDPQKRALNPVALEEWLLELEYDLSWFKQNFQYFEVDAKNNKGIKKLLAYIVEQGLAKHKFVENRRYNKVEKELKGRVCGFDYCNIF